MTTILLWLKTKIGIIVRLLLNVFIITVLVYIFELFMSSLHIESWESFSGKMESADNSILSFARRISPVGFYDSYTGNRTHYRYGAYFYKFSAPFNITRACIEMQKRVYLPEKGIANSIENLTQNELSKDSATNDKVPLYYYLAQPRLSNFKFDNQQYYEESEYLRNACSIDIKSPYVVKESFKRSDWEWILAIPDSVITWIKRICYNDDGSSDWPGRIFLAWTFLFAWSPEVASGKSEKRRSVAKKIAAFIGRFILSIVFFGLVALVIWFAIWAVLKTGKGVSMVNHAVSSFVAGLSTGGAFLKLFLKELREHLTFEGKAKTAESLTGGFLRGFLKK